jgi:formamidopyrimidine-DNA glycosylase
MEGRAVLNLKKFEDIISNSRTVVKPLLMDQKKIGGIGNIYANDALFHAEIDPRRKANSLSSREIKKLYESIMYVLKKGLDSGGASELTFVNILGQDGGYQNHTLVYRKRGKKCPKCGGEIKFTKLGGRGTYFCENCQK